MMKTPRYFSHPITEKLLPETLGQRFKQVADPIWKAAGYRCQLTDYEYAPAKGESHSWLMLEPRDYLGGSKKGERTPATRKEISAAFKSHGLKSSTTQAIDPLLFWSRHVDLAIKHRRGFLIFAPWITQGDLIALFRCLCVGSAQSNFGGSEHALEVINDIEMFGNDDLLKEVTATTGIDGPWDAGAWLEGVRGMPTAEQRAYMREFGVNLRLWPEQTAFRPVVEHWKRVSNENPEIRKTETGNPWLNHYLGKIKEVSGKH